MPLLLTVLSVLALWALLSVLIVGLGLIVKLLESVQGHLEKIATGVRAIETQTAPLEKGARELTAGFGDAEAGLRRVARRLGAGQG